MTRRWTTVWELTVRAGVGWAEEGRGRKNCDNCNRLTIKKLLKIKKQKKSGRFNWTHFRKISLTIERRMGGL